MKKVLALLGAIGLTGSSSAAVISCGAPGLQEGKLGPIQDLDGLELKINFSNTLTVNSVVNSVQNYIKQQLNVDARILVDFYIEDKLWPGLGNTALVQSPGLTTVNAVLESQLIKGSFVLIIVAPTV